MIRKLCPILLILLAAAPCAMAQAPVAIQVNLAAPAGPWNPAWTFVGYDEPNYTYYPNGRKLLGELSALSPTPVYIRTHNLLTTGNGTPALKWGSTNAYTEDANGKPVYDWTILDRIFDTYRDEKVKPLVEIGFMPKALSTHPEPYQHNFPQGSIYTGWSYPPTDYARWGELVFQWVHHLVQRYGAREVETWYFEVWNEPDIGYWHGTPEEYYKLYDYASAAVKRALPTARVGGPHSTGPNAPRAAAFLRGFLEHCVHGKNFATGKIGSPLDYIGFHAKGSPRMVDGHIEMGLKAQLLNVSRGFEIVASFPELKNKPVIIGENDPEGCAACTARTTPHNGYRNSSLYASYTADIVARTMELAKLRGVHVAGSLTWAFEFEDMPWFEGYRTLATHGVDKPILNLFRMLGLMGGERLQVSTGGSVSIDSILASGVRDKPDIGAMATRRGSSAAILVWNYDDDDVDVPPAPIDVTISGVPATARRVLLHHFRVDADHSNSYTAWKDMGSPQSPTPEQIAKLEAAGQLHLLTSPQWLWSQGGSVRVQFSLPREGLSLLALSW